MRSIYRTRPDSHRIGSGLGVPAGAGIARCSASQHTPWKEFGITAWKLAFAFIALISLGRSQEAEPEQVSSDHAPKLAWIVGTWERTEGTKTTLEHWLPHAGTTMMGLSHTYDSKRTHFFEFMRIATHRGKIAYIVQPGGDSPVLFRAVKVTDEEAVFENPKHDHPQRIRYVKTEKGMTATTSLMDGSRATEFAFERRAE